jgi:prophage tail gpP-like protein
MTNIGTITPTPAPPPDAEQQTYRLNTGKEIATLEVRGNLFTNWTTVRIEQRYAQPFPVFQFECTEESPMAPTWDAMQFIPGDIVRAYVGGVPVLFGYITERHVGFDGSNHGIRLIGCGDTVDLTNSMVPPEKLDGHDGQNWSALARDLMQHLGLKLKEIGNVDQEAFDKIAVLPGDTIMSTLERYARMRKILIGSNALGGLLAIGENPAAPSGNINEGIDILRANAAMRDPMIYKRGYVFGQDAGTDTAYGDAQNKQVATWDGTSSRNRISVVVADIADKQHGIQRRAETEKIFTEGSFIEVQLTMQGWFKDQNQSDDIWRAGEYYTVTSPSLILNGFVLGCAGCVYEQNDQGSTTTLSLVNPIHMNGLLNYRDAVLANQQAARDAIQYKIDTQTP